MSDFTKNDAKGETSAQATEAEGPVLSPAEGFQTGRVVSITFGHAVHDTYTAFLAPLLPVFIAKLSLSMTEAGMLEFLRAAPSLLQPFIGHLADRASLRYLVILGPAVTATTMSLVGIAPNYAVLALLVMLAGLSVAAFHAVAPAMAGRLSGRSLGWGMGLWMVGGTLGFAVGPIVIVSAVNSLTLEGTPWLMIGGLLASAILYVRLKDVPARPQTTGQGISFRQALGIMRPLLAPLVGIIVARVLLVSAMYTFLPTFLTEEGANLWFAGTSVSIVAATGMVGSLLAGSLSDRIGRRSVIFISMFTAPLLTFLFLGLDGWARLPVLAAIGITGPAVRTVLMVLVQESHPENRALANGIYLSLSFIMEAMGAAVLGGLGDLFGLRLAFIISAAISLLGLPLIFLLPGKGSAPPEAAEP